MDGLILERDKGTGIYRDRYRTQKERDRKKETKRVKRKEIKRIEDIWIGIH